MKNRTSRKTTMAKILDILKDQQARTISELAAELGISETFVTQTLSEMRLNSAVDRYQKKKGQGGLCLYKLSSVGLSNYWLRRPLKS